jgi:hypothetical protein
MVEMLLPDNNHRNETRLSLGPLQREVVMKGNLAQFSRQSQDVDQRHPPRLQILRTWTSRTSLFRKGLVPPRPLRQSAQHPRPLVVLRSLLSQRP